MTLVMNFYAHDNEVSPFLPIKGWRAIFAGCTTHFRAINFGSQVAVYKGDGERVRRGVHFSVDERRKTQYYQ
jgi:hypothetical protein